MHRFQPAKRTSAPISVGEVSASLTSQLLALEAEIRTTVPADFVGGATKEWLDVCLQSLHDVAKWSPGNESISNRCAHSS